MTLYADYTQIGSNKYYHRDLEARQSIANLGSLASKNKAALATDVSGTLPIANGGTGANNAATARTNLELVKTYGPSTLYVSTSGNDTTGDGTQNSPFRTIKKAVQTVPYINVTNIIVAAGTYSEDEIEIASDKHINMYFSGNVTINSTGNCVFRVANGAILSINTEDSNKLTLNNTTSGGEGMQIRTGGRVLYNGSATNKLIINTKSVCLTAMYHGMFATSGNAVMEMNSTDSHMVNVSYGGDAIFMTVSGSTANVAFRCVAGTIRYYTFTGTYQTLYMANYSGRIYSGAQTSVPNY